MSHVDRLRAEKFKLERRLKEIDALVLEYEALERKMQRILYSEAQNVDDVAADSSIVAPQERNVQSRTHTRARSEDVVRFEKFALRLLAEAVGPVDRNFVLARARDEGIPVGGDNEANTVSARLSRMEGVTSKRGVGYWLQGREAEFFPSEPVASSYDHSPSAKGKSDLSDIL